MTRESFLLSATDAGIALRSGIVRGADLVESCLGRIARREAVVEAWAHLHSRQALTEYVDRLDGVAIAARSFLHGIPVGIKDLVDTHDLPTERGSPLYRGRRPGAGAECVRRLREAGAIIIGKTVTCELASFTPSRTRNPHDPRCTPGGSSSGSAAAVADGHVPLALGTQTAGSVIRPAAFNGVIGFKPTFDAYPTDGVMALAPSLDTLGLFARSIDDIVSTHRILAAADVREAISTGTLLRRPPSIAVVRTPWWSHGEAGMQAAFDQTIAALRRAGAKLTELELPDDFATLVRAQETIFRAEAAREFENDLRERPALIAPAMRESLLVPGLTIGDDELASAKALVAGWRDRFDGITRRFDGVLTPATPGEAPAGLASTGDPVFNKIWTALHVPCLCYPVGRGPRGLPLAVQLVGRRSHDETLLALARWAIDHSGAAPAIPEL